MDEFDKLFGVADNEPDEFEKMFGISNAATIDTSEPERTVGSTIKDVGVSLAKGVVGAGQGLIGLADIPTGGHVGKGLESVGVKPDEWQQDLSKQYSPAQQAANQQVDAATGFVDTAKAMISNPSTIAHGIVETLPSVAAGGVIGRGALAVGSRFAPKAVTSLGKTGSAIAAGAVGEGTIGAGQTAEQIRNQSQDDLLTGKQAGLAAAAGLGTAIFGVVGGRLAKKFDFADVDTMIVNGLNPAKKEGLKGVVKSILGGGITEGVFEELPQTVQETIFTNAALDKPLLEGVPESSAQAIILGGAMGGGANLLPGKDAGPVKTEAELELDRRAGNILIQKDDQIAQSVQKLNEDLKAGQELLADLDKLDQKARELNVSPAELTRKTVYDTKNTQDLLDRIKSEMTKKEEIAKKEYEALSPEDKQVKDIENKLIAQRQAEAQQINSDLEAIKKREEIARKQYKDEKDPEKKSAIAERAISLRKEKDALLNRQLQIQEVNQAKEFAPVKKADELRQEKENFYNRLWLGGTSKDAAESAQVFNEKSTEQQDILDRLLNQIAATQDQQKKQELQKVYDGLFQTFERDAQEAAQTFESQDLSQFDQLVRAKDQERLNKVLEAIVVEPDPQARQKLYEQMFMLPGVKDAAASAEVFAQQGEDADMVQRRKELKQIMSRITQESDPAVRQKLYNQMFQQPGVKSALESAEVFTSTDVKTKTGKPYKSREYLEGIISELPNPESYDIIESPEGFTAVKKVLGSIDNSAFNNEQPVGEVPQFQVGETQNLVKNISLTDIQKAFNDQIVTKAEDGTISIKLKNGKGLTINSIQSAGDGFISFAIETGQMSKEGKILGITVGNKILLDKNFADNKTLWHESMHVLENLGMITEADNSALNKEFNKLRKAGKLKFALSTYNNPELSENENKKQRMIENRANMFAQIMTDRDAYRNTGFGKVIQRVMDFFQQLLAMGKQTVSGLAREVESGKIYERKVGNQTISTTVPMAEEAASKWHSALENAVNSFQQKIGTPDQWKGMIKGYPGIKQEELDWIGLDEWLDSKDGKVSKDELVKFIAENNVRLEEVVKGWTVEKEQRLTDLDNKLRETGNLSVDEQDEYNSLINEESFSKTLGSDTKYANYQLPGGKNYQELLITLPLGNKPSKEQAQLFNYRKQLENKYGQNLTYDDLVEAITREEKIELNKLEDLFYANESKPIDSKDRYKSSHWDEPNILTHIRFNERTDADGNRVLFLEEVQSDWHQAGRKTGYDTTKEYDKIKAFAEQHGITIRTGPKETLPVKERVFLRRAAENTIGIDLMEDMLDAHEAEIQYSIPYAPFKKSWPLLAMKRMIRYAAENGFDKIAWTTGQQQADRYGEANIKAEGMKGFYDQMLPSMLNKEFNRGKWGNAKVEATDIGLQKDGKVTITEAIKAFSDGKQVFVGDHLAQSRNEIETYPYDDLTIPMPEHVLSLPITNRMKSKALREGMPMFEVTNLKDREYLTAVSNNDISQAQKLVDNAAKESGYTETVYHWGRIPLSDASELPNLGTVLLANTPLTEEQKIELGPIFRLYRTKQLGNGLYVSRNPNRWEGYVKNGDGGFLVPIDDNAISDEFFNQILNDEKLSKFFNVSKLAIDRYENKNPGQGWKVYRNELLGFKRKLYDIASKNLKNLPIKKYKLYYNPDKLITGNEYSDSSDLAYRNKNKDIENIDDNEIKIVNSGAVKSADAITYHNGNVIPLSERFQNTNVNINFEVRETPEQKISDETYNQMFTERNSLVRTIGQTLRMRGHEIKQLFDKGLGSISTRLKNVDPMLRSEIRNLDFRTAQKIVTALRIAHPLLEKTKQMSPQDKFVWDVARRNSDEVKIKELAEKYGMTADQEKLRSVLNQIREEAKDVGYDVGFIEEYWPRIIKDQEGFLQATKGISQRPVITDAIKKYADKLGMTVEKFEAEFPEQAADIASNTILGRNLGIGGPGNIQARQYEVVPPELNKFYMDSDAALMQYIYSMIKKIEARRFFGKVPERIANLKTEKKRKTAMLKEYELTNNTARIDDVASDLLRIEQELDKYKLQRDYTENIGTYINDLRMSGRIQAEDEKTVRDILDARFHEHGTTGPINAYKNMAYIDVMGSPLSALTQIGDLAWAMYVGKVWTPRGLANTIKNVGKATSGSFRNSKYLGGIYKTFGGSKITKEDLGIERIAQEFADGTTLGNAVSWVFKKVQLERIDSIGKETLINNAFDNYKVMASTEAGRTELLKQLKPIFGTQSESVINDLLAGNSTDNVKMLLYHRLLDFQPVALSEMPEQYLKSGNGRVFYMLKTYTIKQFDVFRNEAWHKIKTGEKDQVIEGIGNMIKLVSLLTLANAGADELKDFLLGKDVKFEDHVIENFLTMGGASKYVRMQTTREGLGSGLAGQILPPFRFINSISKDLGQGYGDYIAGDTINFDNTRIVESIPIAGKIYYWHYGRGEDYKKSSNEQEFTNVGKEVKLFKRQLENVEDKRTFLNSNIDKFKQMKLHENFQASLNRNQAVINKLKEIEQTTNVRERLGQLQQQREMLLNKYFEVAAGLQ